MWLRRHTPYPLARWSDGVAVAGRLRSSTTSSRVRSPRHALHRPALPALPALPARPKRWHAGRHDRGCMFGLRDEQLELTARCSARGRRCFPPCAASRQSTSSAAGSSSWCGTAHRSPCSKYGLSSNETARITSGCGSSGVGLEAVQVQHRLLGVVAAW